MANDEHFAMFKQGVAAWNAWRDQNPNIHPDLRQDAAVWNTWREQHDVPYPDLARAHLDRTDLSGANLTGVDFRGADLNGANLLGANLKGANLSGALLTWATLIGANLNGANLFGANLIGAHLDGATLIHTTLYWANLNRTHFSNADLSGANLLGAHLYGANLTKVNLSKANLIGAHFSEATLCGAILTGADLNQANLSNANLTEADLRGANLKNAVLVNTILANADLTGCYIYGISAWDLKLAETKQQNLVITPPNEPEITVDNIEVAQFVYLLLHNEKIRDVIDTIGKKGVLLLGRFTDGRIKILERLREKLRSLGYVPMVFNFDKPGTKDFTETVRLLAGLSKFVIVDLTSPRSAPLELQAIVPQCMIPFAPIIQRPQKPFSMLVDLQNKHDWVLQPVIGYSSVNSLIKALEDKVVRPAEAKFNKLLARRTKQLGVENV